MDKLTELTNTFSDKFDLSHIDLKNDYELYESLLGLTKVCEKCSNNVCNGGYNCKYGAVSNEYKICKNDKQYLEGMIEHHSMALFTSEEILKKTNDYNIAKIAKNIIQTQNDEIREMRELLNKK